MFVISPVWIFRQILQQENNYHKFYLHLVVLNKIEWYNIDSYLLTLKKSNFVFSFKMLFFKAWNSPLHFQTIFKFIIKLSANQPIYL